MDSNRKTAIIVGVLFIIATVAPIISVVPLSVVPLGFLGSVGDPDYLTAVSANENKVLIGVLFQVTLTASVVAIPIVLYPLLRVHHEILALAYVGARVFEGIADAAIALSQLLILTLSREFVMAEYPPTEATKDEME